jgi:hypothetical protein
LSLGLTKEIYEGVINEVHKNKLINLKRELKGKNKKPDTINAVIRDSLEKTLLKK